MRISIPRFAPSPLWSLVSDFIQMPWPYFQFNHVFSKLRERVETSLHILKSFWGGINTALVNSHLLQSVSDVILYTLWSIRWKISSKYIQRCLSFFLKILKCVFHLISVAKDKEGKNILYYCIHATKRHQECMELCLKYGAYQHNIVSIATRKAFVLGVATKPQNRRKKIDYVVRRYGSKWANENVKLDLLCVLRTESAYRLHWNDQIIKVWKRTLSVYRKPKLTRSARLKGLLLNPFWLWWNFKHWLDVLCF